MARSASGGLAGRTQRGRGEHLSRAVRRAYLLREVFFAPFFAPFLADFLAAFLAFLTVFFAATFAPLILLG